LLIFLADCEFEQLGAVGQCFLERIDRFDDIGKARALLAKALCVIRIRPD
jgi:hypothetical protein